jgi:hypothetical protein
LAAQLAVTEKAQGPLLMRGQPQVTEDGQALAEPLSRFPMIAQRLLGKAELK